MSTSEGCPEPSTVVPEREYKKCCVCDGIMTGSLQCFKCKKDVHILCSNNVTFRGDRMCKNCLP